MSSLFTDSYRRIVFLLYVTIYPRYIFSSYLSDPHVRIFYFLTSITDNQVVNLHDSLRRNLQGTRAVNHRWNHHVNHRASLHDNHHPNLHDNRLDSQRTNPLLNHLNNQRDVQPCSLHVSLPCNLRASRIRVRPRNHHVNLRDSPHANLSCVRLLNRHEFPPCNHLVSLLVVHLLNPPYNPRCVPLYNQVHSLLANRLVVLLVNLHGNLQDSLLDNPVYNLQWYLPDDHLVNPPVDLR